MRTLCFLLFSVIFFNIQAQNISKPKSSLDALIKGYENLNSEEYNKALEAYGSISRSDTNYVFAQLQTCITLYYKEEYAKLNELAEGMIEDFEDFNSDFYKWWLKSITKQKDWESFDKIYEKATSKYPLNHYYEVLKGLALKEQEKYEAAKLHFQELLKVHALSDQVHYQLGLLAAEEGKLVEALISIQFAVVCNNGMENLSKAFQMIQDLSENNFNPSRASETINTPFKEVKEILESEVALKSSYQSSISLSFPVIQQADVLLKSLEYQEGTEDFWMNFYVPLLVKFQDDKSVRGYILSFLKVLQAPEVKSLENKYKSEIERVQEVVVDYYQKQTRVISYPVNGKTYDDWYHYGSDNNLYGVGKLKGDERDGEWTYFYPSGNTKSELNYKSGEISGFNQWYDRNGNVIQYYTLKDGKIDGEALFSYDDNNLPSSLSQSKNGELDGFYKNYYKNGLLKEIYQFKDGKKEGPYYQFSYRGDTMVKAFYKNNVLEGEYLDLYSNGDIYFKVQYENGAKDGKYVKYYRNGNVLTEGQYQNGNQYGEWKDYHDNGQLEYAYTMTNNGKVDGVFIQFNYNGDTARIGELKKGKLHGIEKNYATDGWLISEIKYKNGVIKKHKYFDREGNVLRDGKKYLVVYDEFGFKSHEGGFKGKKGEDGVWKYYYNNGVTKSIHNYEKGNLTGERKYFYYSGELESKYNYKDGELHGYAVTYYKNGEIKEEGWYLNGNKEGDWKEYEMNGKISDHSYYIKGNSDRFRIEYNENGKLHAESFYEGDILRWIAFYDTLENRIDKVEFDRGSGEYKAKAVMSGQNYIDGEMVNGTRHGVFKFLYVNGEPSTVYNYEYGTLHGEYKNYYSNGKIYQEGNYDRGSEHGKWITYHRNGKVKREQVFKYGVLTDSSIHYFADGTVYKIKHYNGEGEVHGIVKQYNPNGTIQSEIPYQNGVIHGSYVYYSPTNQPVYKKFYNGDLFVGYSYQKNGEWVEMIPIKGKTKAVAYYPNGQKSVEFTHENGNYTGKYIRYYANGKVWDETDYLNGSLHGISKEYNLDGSLKLDAEYYYGYRHGKYNEYDASGNPIQLANYDQGSRNGITKYYNNGNLEKTVNYYYGKTLSIK